MRVEQKNYGDVSRMDHYIRTVAEMVIGDSKEKRHYNKEITWWSVEIL